MINYFDISHFDNDHEWENYYLEKCGLRLSEKHLLTREKFELVLEEIIDEIEIVKDHCLKGIKSYNFDWVLSLDNIHIGYQILSLILLDLHIPIPEEVYDSILVSTDWNYDKKRLWSEDYVNIRKKNLKLFRREIIFHKSNRL